MLKTAGIALAVLVSAPSVAQEIVEAIPPEPFTEHFDRNADVSGARLVGLQLGASAPLVGPLYVRLDSPAAALCVRTISQDGRYSAANPFAVPAASAPAVVRIPAISQHYVSELGQYAPGAVAVRIFAAADADCNPANATNLPYSGSPEPAATLVALVNGRSFSGRLELKADDGAVLAAAECAQAGDSARIAYDMSCSATLPAGPARNGTLSLVFNDGFADEVYDYQIALPAMAAQ